METKSRKKHRRENRKEKLNSSSEDPRLKTGKKVKRKKGYSKTKFEEYVEMDMQNGMFGSAEADLKLERELARKLKVKGGKLPGAEDCLNSLLEFTLPHSDSESLEDEEEFQRDTRKTAGEEAFDAASSSKKRASSSAQQKKCKKKKSSKEGIKKGREEENLGQVLDDSVVDEVAADGLSNPTQALESPSEKVSRLPLAANRNTKYVAPHLRSRPRNDLEYTQIRRQVRGLLNRLSESNVESVTGEISNIFHSVARSVGSQIISEEVLASCSGGPRGNQQYAAIFAAFVAGLACMVGIDFSAKLIASLAQSFEDEYQKEDNLSLRNLTLLLAYLWKFGVYSSDLLYDFLVMLSKRLTEVDVSTILTILQCCGMKLRGDDPTAMKFFIQCVQNSVNELKSSGDGQKNINNKRMEFMLEIICDIKNNKKNFKEEPAQHAQIKKWLQKLRVEEILIRGVTWSKLLDPNKEGQWWCSGDKASERDNVDDVAATIDKEVLEAQKMLQLAAKQRMNTDARRAIFCIIMTGEDYIDAFEKLLRLDLSGKQDREIMRVLVECCLQEKIFNKYYTVLASKLCGHDKNHKFTLQYCLWDHFKELESMQLLRLMHLSRFVAEMFASFTLSLSILKSVDLGDPTQLSPKSIMHFRLLFEALFEYPDELVWNMFTRIAVAPEFEILRSSIEFFINMYVMSTANKSISQKIRVAKKALANVEGVLV